MIITISHQKGGVGKSTLAWNLIIEYSKRRKVYVIDLDMQKTITYSVEIRKNKFREKELKNIILLNPSSEKDMINILIQNQQSDNFMIIDSGGFDSGLNRIAITASDILLTPVSSKFYELLGLKEYSKILNNINEEIRSKNELPLVANVVMNKINPNTIDLSEMKNFIESDKNFSLMDSIIRQRVDYENSPSVGESVVEFNPESKATIEFNKFKKELDNIINS